MTTFIAEIPSPYGLLSVTEHNGAITAIDWRKPENTQTSPLLEETAKQMAAYFAGDLQEFDLPLAPKGNEFQQSVCALMCEIPYGETTTYGAIAEKLGTYGQPVGNACGAISFRSSFRATACWRRTGLAAILAMAAWSARLNC